MGVERLLPPLVIGPDPNNPCAGGKKCYTDQYGQWDCNTGNPCSPAPKCPSANVTLEERGYEFSTPVEGENCVTKTQQSVKQETELQIEGEIGENVTSGYTKSKIGEYYTFPGGGLAAAQSAGLAGSTSKEIPVVETTDGESIIESLATDFANTAIDILYDLEDVQTKIDDAYSWMGISYDLHECASQSRGDKYTETVFDPATGKTVTRDISKEKAKGKYDDYFESDATTEVSVEYEEHGLSALSDLLTYKKEIGDTGWTFNVGPKSFGTKHITTETGDTFTFNWNKADASNKSENPAPVPDSTKQKTKNTGARTNSKGPSKGQPINTGDQGHGSDKTTATTTRNPGSSTESEDWYADVGVGVSKHYEDSDYYINAEVIFRDAFNKDIDIEDKMCFRLGVMLPWEKFFD